MSAKDMFEKLGYGIDEENEKEILYMLDEALKPIKRELDLYEMLEGNYEE